MKRKTMSEVFGEKKIEKRPGADWEVIFQSADGTYGIATIFGLNDMTKLNMEITSAIPYDAEMVQVKRLGFNELDVEIE